MTTAKLIAYREFDPEWIAAVCDGHVVGWKAAAVDGTGELILTCAGDYAGQPRAWLVPIGIEAPTGSRVMGRPVPVINA